MDLYGFYTGKIFDAHRFLGCILQGNGAVFRTFAPAAERITVIGEFNGWKEMEMQRICDRNFWECEIPEVKPGQMYKYRIYKRGGQCVDHCDPYGYGMELRPNCASVVRDLRAYSFGDKEWMDRRSDCREKPLNIYEMHAGSWKTNKADENGWYTYTELADILIPYLKEYGYNYVEFMPLSEHPSDESWGYQSTGFFAPTARYGTADQLKEMVDKLHQAEIGVILDFVPVHFAVDGYALAHYDGTALYEYPHQDVGRSEWGSCNFIHSRGEVRSFLQSCASYWMEEYHVDGLRMDAISNMIYWQGDKARGVNKNAVEFLQYMNQGLKERHPGILLAAEDSTSYGKVTKAAWEGGLGFDYKWDMGWMNDTLDYFRTDPLFRGGAYHKLTFSMMYYPEENYLLPLSHDEVVHGKATIVQKMNGQYENKFPQAKALYMYMYAHPGKKLNFMGNELGHLREWDEKRELDWDMLKYPVHDSFHRFIKDLNQLYLEHPELWQWDYKPEGFRWIDCHQEERCIYAMERSNGYKKMIAVFNFSGVEQKAYSFESEDGVYEAALYSEQDIYGGTEMGKLRFETKKGNVTMDLPAFSAVFLVKAANEVKGKG
ncbi:MAG: 1,4-alpha-glucan branching protein GlgB [Dorea sp.]|jgi:1,4-alpha-glucan branching enzyme|nr:1,4-alpha-glucan branching protein GlgB [Dorea sp.]